MAPPPTEADIAESERLKALGNDHYQQGENDAARHKYSEAIKRNPLNAILYANRAAVLLATKQYLDAVSDCQKAVELDPKYAKAWGRLGSASLALEHWPQAIRSFKTALSCLPQPPLTLSPRDDSLKRDLEGSLKKAREGRQRTIGSELIEVSEQGMGHVPWDRAEELFDAKAVELHATGKESSVMIITQANGALQEGLEYLSQVQVVKTTEQGERLEHRHTAVVQLLSDSILTCDRIFHARDISAFMDNVQKQCMFENAHTKGWVNAGGPAIVKEESVKRLKKEGWGSVSRALETTIRIWILQGTLRARILGHREFAHECYSRALDLLEWGRKEWPNIPIEKRGCVFEKTFLRAVKRLKAENMHALVAGGGEKCPITLQDLVDEAEDLVDNVDQNPYSILPGTEMDISTILAFWKYPKGVAHSVIGWAMLEEALRRPSTDPAQREYLLQAASHYKLSAESIPSDDPMHSRFLRKHLECLCALSRPLLETLPVAKIILDRASEALDVWGSQMSGRLKKNVEEVRTWVGECEKQVEEGECGMGDVRKIGFTRRGERREDAIPVRVVYPQEEEEGSS